MSSVKCRWRYFKSGQIQCLHGTGRQLQSSGTLVWKQRSGPSTSLQNQNNDRNRQHDLLNETNFLPGLDNSCFIQDQSSRLAAHVHAVESVCSTCFIRGSLWLERKKTHLSVAVSLLLCLFLKSWTQVQPGHLVCQNHSGLRHLRAKHVRNDPQQQEPNLGAP